MQCNLPNGFSTICKQYNGNKIDTTTDNRGLTCSTNVNKR